VSGRYEHNELVRFMNHDSHDTNLDSETQNRSMQILTRVHAADATVILMTPIRSVAYKLSKEYPGDPRSK
jgi:ABC-type ATPase involved in cell division